MQIDKVISFIRSQKNGFFLIEVRSDSQLEAIENTLKDIFFEKQYEIDTSFFSIKPEDASKSISIEQIRKLKKEFLHTNVLDLHKIIYLSDCVPLSLASRCLIFVILFTLSFLNFFKIFKLLF